jgi:hypothetical protein
VEGRSAAGPYRVFAAAVAAVAAVVLIVTQVIAGDGGQGEIVDDGDHTVRLEPLNYLPPDPFTPPLQPDVLATGATGLTGGTGATGATGPVCTPEQAQQNQCVDTTLQTGVLLDVEPASAGAVRTVGADEVGLYGGSMRYSRCQRQKLVDFLTSSGAKARAWVAALNADPGLSWSGGSRLTVNDIRTYIFELTPVVLRADTWVTNHGFSNGRATRLQAVLQAGTAVLVDEYGIPRVKCYCGNPLLPPDDFEPTYTGDRWDGFDPGKIIVINRPTTIIDVFILTDVRGGGLIRRPRGTDGIQDTFDFPQTGPTGTGPTGATGTGPTFTPPPDVDLGTGDVQVTLLWASGDDLDLHVFDPAGNELYYGDPRAPGQGRLDHDDRAGCGTEGTHAENVFWPTGAAPSGTYQWYVVNYSGCGEPAAFSVQIKVGGAILQNVDGTLGGGQTTETFTFDA